MKTSTLTIALTLTALAGTAAAQSFTPIADLPGGNGFCYGSGIARDGQTACGTSESASGSRAYIWTPGTGTTQLSGAPANMIDCEAYDLTGDGRTVIGRMQFSGDAFPGRLFRWTQSTGIVELPAWAGHTGLIALQSSFDGSALAGSANNTAAGTSNAYRWNGAGYVEIPNLPGSSNGTGYGLSGDGSTVVGFSYLPGLVHGAFRWTSATGTVALSDLPGGSVGSDATAASYDGKVIVGSSYGVNGAEPVRWAVGGGVIGLGNFPAAIPSGSAQSCSGDGSVIVGYSRNAADEYEAFVWDIGHGLRSVKSALASVGVTVPAGWKLGYAQRVSYDGTVIVGVGTDPLGKTRGYVARLKNTCPGDLNQDGLINTADLTIFLGNFGKATVPLLGGDLNGSGSVNTADLTQFLGLFGSAC
jgi:uncharacterized membrane protein